MTTCRTTSSCASNWPATSSAADPNSGVGYRGIVATGFLALGKKALAQKDLPLKRYDVVDDQIDVTAKAFLGLTVTCARCHDHKFDPIATKDYYQMAAIFASTSELRRRRNRRSDSDAAGPAGRIRSLQEAVERTTTTLEKKLSKIIDFDRGRAEGSRRGSKRRSRLPCWPLTGSTRKGEALAAVAAASKLDETRSPAGWNISRRKRPELAKWNAATEANRKEIAAEYQEDFRRSAYQYDQDLSWWKQAQEKFSECGKDRRPSPPHERGEEMPSSSPHGRMAVRMHRSETEQMAALPRRKSEGGRDAAGAGSRNGKDPSHQGSPHGVRRQRRSGPWIRKIFVRGDYHNLGDPVERNGPVDSAAQRARLPKSKPRAVAWNWPTGSSIRAIRCRRV